MKLCVLFVHGIGDQKKDWADGIVRQTGEKLVAEARRLLGDSAPADASDMVDVEAVYWKDIFRKNQNELEGILSKSARKELKATWTVRVFRFLRHLLNKFYSFLHRLITRYIGDIIGYLDKKAEKLVHAKVAASLARLAAADGGGKKPLTVVAHSLGTVISSDYVYDAYKRNGWKTFDADLRFDNFFTVGSPLALFSLQYGGPEAFTKPVRVEPEHGRWVNLFDIDDPVGMPLKSLNPEYGKAVACDVCVDAGVFGLSHTAYFTSSRVLDVIAKKLALDWAFLNGRLDAARATALYREFDASLLGAASS